MITCFHRRCVIAPKSTIVVRVEGHTRWSVYVCEGHHSEGFHAGMDVIASIGGSMSTVALDIPSRTVRDDVPVSTLLPRDEHTAMVLVSQGRRMSMRQYVREAINNQVRLDQLQLKRRVEK
jgi:hypothetical protein